MNAFASECSSGCESGWTLYLEQSFLSTKLVDTKKERRTTTSRRRRSSSSSRTTGVCGNDRGKMVLMGSDQDQEIDNINNHEEGEEEEDLSMLSDASSGPPTTTATHHHHFHEDKESHSFNYYDNGCNFCPPFDINNGGGAIRQNELVPSFLDDTASSPANFNWSKNNQASMQSTFDSAAGFSSNNFEQGRSAYQGHLSCNVQPSSLSGNQLHNNQWF